VDGKASWKTNGFVGEYDIATGLKCPAEPAFAIQKQQKIEGSNEGFTTGTLSGQVGQTVDYQITVTNTGNVPLTFSNFTDAKCSGVAGGPTGALELGKSATYTCSHALTLADANKPYENSAAVTGTPPVGQGSAITQTSNTVVTNVPFTAKPAFSIEKSQRASNAELFTTSLVSAKPGNTLEYEIVVTNTGNVPLKFSGFSDPNCTGVTGGPGESEVAPGAFTVYLCSHEVTEEDATAGVYKNAATDTGTPAEVFGSPVTHESNTVEAAVSPTPAPAFTIQKLQRDGEPTYTELEINAPETTTIEYEVIVTNTGNVPLTFSALTDPNCTGVAGGSGEEALAPGKSATFTCSHQVTQADVEATTYSNTATITGTPPAGDGAPITHESNTVVAKPEAFV
jgi:uncharacterized repeat protein (TIGR01451 family)